MKKQIFFYLFIWWSGAIIAQSTLSNDLIFYCDVMANAVLDESRTRANDQFKESFSDFIRSENSFNVNLDTLKWISVKYPEDRSFRVITWQLKENENQYRYFGYIQHSNGQFFELKERMDFDEDVDFELLSSDEWYGALYYNIIERKDANGSFYVLFGYHGQNELQRRKIADVLSFDGREPVFGREIFQEKRDGIRPLIRSRLKLDYSSEANVNFNYNPGMNLIVHDYVIPRMDFRRGDRMMLIPDGTYVAYEWDGAYWTKIDMLPVQETSAGEIFYKPKSKDDKDLFGRQRKPRNK
jgi:hypothetical protein